MTYSSPLTGHSVGASYLIPKTKDDLTFRRMMIQEWARQSAGVMGRSPDYMNTALMTFAASKELFSEHIQNGNKMGGIFMKWRVNKIYRLLIHF
jgi:4-hydroxyphenylacetate 3-monooxygenase